MAEVEVHKFRYHKSLFKNDRGGRHTKHGVVEQAPCRVGWFKKGQKYFNSQEKKGIKFSEPFFFSFLRRKGVPLFDLCLVRVPREERTVNSEVMLLLVHFSGPIQARARRTKTFAAKLLTNVPVDGTEEI